MIFGNAFGYVISVKDQVVLAKGLTNVFLGELVRFKERTSFITGLVFNIERDETIKIVLISGLQFELKQGMKVYRSYASLSIQTGFCMLGRVLSPSGVCYNESEIQDTYRRLITVVNSQYLPVEAEAPGVIDRSPVRTPYMTGIHTVDSLIPVGSGQRELIIGDKNTGKTTLGLTAILHQRFYNHEIAGHWRGVEDFLLSDRHSCFRPCIYVSIGQRRSEIHRVKTLFNRLNVLYYTTIIFTSADDNPALQYIAPFAGTTVGEWFRDNGYNSLIVYDDLSNHAVAYRQMCLLLRRPPGREAYPGDVFYLHARLLERSAQLHKRRGAGSLTSLPIIETKGNDISAFIPTNVISITDGQIYLSSDVATKGIRPAIDIGLSVSRVGGAAQVPSMNAVSKKLKRDYVLYQSFQGIEKLGGSSDPLVTGYIARGKRITSYLTQGLYSTSSLYSQVVCLFHLTNGSTDRVHEFLIGVYFKLLFNVSLASHYLPVQLYRYIYSDGTFESYLYSFDFSLVEDILSKWTSAYEDFFLKNVQPRIASNDSILFKRALKGFFVI
jgi:F-type H+-transporting ATPase subunit alpha